MRDKICCTHDCNQGRECACGEDLPQRGTGVVLVVLLSMAAIGIISLSYILNRC